MRLIILTILSCILSACDQSAQQPDGRTLTVWAHAGQPGERNTLERQLADYDRAHQDVAIELTFIPERSYNAQVQAAAVSGDLPDLLEFDAPYLASYAWQNRLVPLQPLMPESVLQDMLPSIIEQGRYRGELYGLGMFDSGLALYAHRDQLDAIGARIPTQPDDAWTLQEFDMILTELAARDPDGRVLDLKLNYPDEWFSYAFSPLLQSAGGDLVARSRYHRYRKAQGVLNGPASVRAMQALQHWFDNQRVDPNLDDGAFVEGRVALSWAGHWEYARYRRAFGEKLVLLPLPDLGKGSRTGQGSWMWGVPRSTRHPQQSAALIRHLLQPAHILQMVEANGAVPATGRAIEESELYRPGGPLHLFVVQLEQGHAVPRPRTPAYPVISAAFRQAFANIRNGMAVQQALDRAAETIDREIRDNKGYPVIDAR